MNLLGTCLAPRNGVCFLFVMLLTVGAPIPVMAIDEIPNVLQGIFVGQGDLSGRFEQRPGRRDSLLLRWPDLIDRAAPDVAVNYEAADIAGSFRQAETPSLTADMSWARLRDGVLSSYRLRLQRGGGFVLEIVHREASAEGLRIRWTLLRDGEIAEGGKGVAVKGGRTGAEG